MMIKEIIKEILTEEFKSEDKNRNTTIFQRYIGKYVIVRSYSEGLNAGIVVEADSTGIVLKNARRLWWHKPIKGSWYEGVANYGISSDSKISAAVEEKAIVEKYSITLVSDDARKTIEGLDEYISK